MDVADLRKFYTTPLGATARRLIAHHLRQLPRPPKDARVLGLGFAAPWLDRYRRGGREVFSFMPAHQGIIHWPQEGPSASALVDETALPLSDGSMDLALVIHGLELTQHRPAMLSELWRVLAPQGHAIFVVPNRRGMWARMDTTPFGHGRPFSRRQLEKRLAEAMFKPVRFQPALFVPPVQRAFLLRSATVWERLGLTFWQGFSGLVIIEAVKQVYAIRPQRDVSLAFPGLRPLALPGAASRGARAALRRAARR
jgi:SAM-dependent methyltransferase